jgi:hypothetical protein
MCSHNAVADFELFDVLTDFDNFARNLVPQYQRGFLDTVPFQDITAANSACLHTHQDLTRPDFWDWQIFDPDVIVVIVHGYAHSATLTVQNCLDYSKKLKPEFLLPTPPYHFYHNNSGIIQVLYYV